MDLVFIKDINDYMAYKELKPVNNYKYKKVQFICSVCKQVKTKTFKALTTDFICSNCTISKSVSTDEVLNKKRSTCQERYGVDNYNKSDESKEKHKQTCIEKYGVDHYTKTEEYKTNTVNKCIEKYGVTNVFQLPEVKEKSKNTTFNKYGTEFYTQTDEFKERYANTCIEKYGVSNISQCNSIIEQKKQTCFDHFGVNFPLQNPDIRRNSQHKYTFNNESFDSIPELAYYIWLTDNNITFEYQPKAVFSYEFDNKIHQYHPDFYVNEQFIELKGLQFFIDKDPTKQLINPYDRTQDGLYAAKQQCMINNNVKILTDNDYNKYINYVNEKYTKDFLPLFKNNLPFPYINSELNDKSDYGLIQHFHKSIYNANRFGKPSPINAWQNKNLIYKIALNRLKYIGHCKPSDILQGLNVTKQAPKVSIFKPKLAERLIKTYISDANIIIDPFSGFSGRMLGAFNSNIQYCGYDINEQHVKESNEIIDYKKISNMATISVQDILKTAETDWSSNNVCLFTCPPYNLKEQWNDNETDLSCDEWIDICLSKHKGCTKYLFVVDSTEKYKPNIVETIDNSSHFGKNTEYVILINNT